MQIANCQVFTLLAMVGLLMFFTTFLTIDFHTSNGQSSVHSGHEFFHAPRKLGFGSDPMTRTVDAVISQIKSFRANKTFPVLGTSSLVTVPLDPISSKTNSQPIANDQAGSSHKATVKDNSVPSPADNDNDQRCKVTFEPKCRINPLVKYWDEVMECYKSPLRDLIGLDAPLEDRKFVVFQADAGGWNNIRMALEVVILFAQVSNITHCLCCSKIAFSDRVFSASEVTISFQICLFFLFFLLSGHRTHPGAPTQRRIVSAAPQQEMGRQQEQHGGLLRLR